MLIKPIKQVMTFFNWKQNTHKNVYVPDHTTVSRKTLILVTYLLTYQKARCFGCIGRGEVHPFVEDENNKVEEDAQHENKLRDELTKDVQRISEVPAYVKINNS